MRHGTATPPLPAFGLAGRIARLSAEFIDATPERQEQIGREVQALIDGRLFCVGGQ